MKLKHFFLALFLTSFIGCSEQYLDLDFPFPDQSLVMYGEIEANGLAKIRIGLTPDKKDIVNDEYGVEGAIVLALNSSDQVIDTLYFDNDERMYFSKTTFQHGESYYITASYSNFPKLVSSIVRVPENLVDIEYSFSYENRLGAYCSPNFFPFEIDISLNQLTIKDFIRTELESLTHDCFWDISLGQCEQFFTIDCYNPGDTYKYRNTLDLGYNVEFTGVPIGKEYSFVIKEANYSESFKLFSESIDQPYSVTDGFTEPKSTYSNITGGYGILYAVYRSPVDTISFITE